VEASTKVSEAQGPGSDLADIALSEPSGYSTHDEYWAMRFQQGGRVVYSVDLSVPQLVATLPEPDPNRPQEGNRRINLAHARGFSEYIQERENWVCPSLLLRAPEGEFDFESVNMIGGTELGKLAIPRLARNALQILDGQHRILGFHLAWRAISEKLQERREALTLARRHGPAELVRDAERRLKRALGLRERMAGARVSIDIVIVDDPEAYKQVFVDIADNAKGVTRSLSARFDRRKVVHRALPLVVEHPLLKGRVEEESDRLSSTNSNLMTAKNVADIIRTVQVGAARRISRRLEDELEERRVAENTTRFLDVMEDAFPDLKAIEDGHKAPGELRHESLLGSATMLRIFAGVYHELVMRDENPADRMTDSEATTFLGKFADHLGVPIEDDGAWKATGLFKESGMAPEASQGDIKKLVDVIVGWSEEEPEWLA
jgi:DNA-sulfur modification-associated